MKNKKITVYPNNFNRYGLRGCMIILAVMISIVLLQGVSAWENNTFNNSLGTEVLDFASAGNIVRGLLVPQSVFVTYGFINLTYPTISESSYVTSIPSGLVAYYNFDETSGNLIDRWKGRYNGSLHGSGIVRPVNGIIGTAYNFSLVAGSYINISISANTNLNFTNNMSVSAWINSSHYGTTKDIIANAFSSAGYVLYLNNSNSVIGDVYTGSGVVTVKSPKPIGNGTWQMVSLTANGTDIVLYLNNSQIDKEVYDGTILSSPYDTIIGAAANGLLNEQFAGVIDDIGLWNRSLNPIEIINLYSNSSYSGKFSISIGSTEAYNITITNSSSSVNISTVTSNLKGYINNYLSTCTYIGGYCTVPFVFNSTIGGIFIAYNNLNFSNYGFSENSQTFNASSYETAKESFEINLTYDSSYYSNILANLFYNGTSYAGTKTGTGNDVLFKRNVFVPLVNGNKEVYWEVRAYNGTAWDFYNSTFGNQSIGLINFSFCGGTNNIPYVNFTFKNETTAQESILSTFVSTFWYWLGSGSTVNKSYSYTNLVENKSYGFCFTPTNRTLNLLTSATYSNSESPQRGYGATLTLTNVTTNKTLYLLPNSLGTYVTFQTINQAQQVVTDVLITVSSALGTLESKTTDASGGATFFLNPLTSYTITSTKEGYADYVFVITPTQSQYTIIMTQTSTGNFSDLMKGITFTTEPKGSELVNGTTYEFNFTISSTYWSLDNFGFILTNGSDTLGSVSSTIATGGTVRLSMNTGDNKTIHMNYYWSANGTTFNASSGSSSGSFRTWYVRNTYGEAWSLKTLFVDLKSYFDSGMFGMTNFTLALLLFFAIFIFVGVLSYRFGITSPAAIMGVIVGITALFDWGFNLIPIKYGLATWIILAITFAYAAWEWSK